MSLRTLRFLLPFSLALAAATNLSAQSTGPSSEQLKSWITVREQRVDLLREEIKQNDLRIEARMDEIVRTLSSIADSKDSRTKVARMKEDTMKRLAKSVESYDQKRRVFRQELANPQSALTADDKRKLIAPFDARIEKRAEQILTLNKSMPTHKDYERYNSAGGGWYGSEYQRNEDFEQNRRMTAHSNTQRDLLSKQLDTSIGRLERMGRELRSQLATTSDSAQRKERTADIAKNDALIAERREQKQELLSSGNPGSREVALKEAMDIDQAMKKSINELRRDFGTLFQRFNTLVSELTALRATEATLAAKKSH